ncbi:unnamed protein product [Phytophthora fragariaefolia]|uniref:Unnamed protein product n=1 Tax=Phytophthora fragariaefolia TaxID=1490495 RepID=A0A9W6YNY2_9STRA|nr:unnamed protein product [Phytophthora fragariaefolia]
MQLTYSQGLIERLKQAEERGLVIVQALQELKTSLQILQDRQTAPSARPSRTHAARDDTTITKPTTGGSRTPLIQRMGSFVGLTSGSSLESKRQGQTSKQSPTRYTDELFSQSSSIISDQASYQENQHSYRHHQSIFTQTASFIFSSEMGSHHSMAEISPFNQPAARALTPPTAAIDYKIPEGQRVSSKSLTSTQPEENHQPMLFQRMQGAPRVRTELAPTTKTAPGEQTQRKMFQRTHSQSMRTLTEALTTHIPPHGSLSNAQARVLKRMGSFVSDTSALNSKQSPTYYADELFRRKSIELSKDHTWESAK